MISEMSGLADRFLSWAGRRCGTGGTLAGMVEPEVAEPAANGLVLRDRRLDLWLSLLER
jgi:hypothetical protein